jgi:hypothetical protein
MSAPERGPEWYAHPDRLGPIRLGARAWPFVTMTRAEWDRKHRDYKTGDPRKGTARVLVLDEHGTGLVPVRIVDGAA